MRVEIERKPADRGARVYIAGHGGLVGSALWRHLTTQGFKDLVGRRSEQVDLKDRASTFDLLEELRPSIVIIAAAKVGGIGANAAYPVEFLSENLRIQSNVMDAAHAVGVQRLLFLGSSCIYPKLAPQPIRESSLLTGPLEPTNDAYAIAKIAGIQSVQAYRRQYGRRWISAMPTNLYGPGDSFDLANSHVLPALIRRFDEAVERRVPSVTLWGTGTPRREFLHVDDLASACLHLLDHYDEPEPINVGVGQDLPIRELAELVSALSGYHGEITWDSSMPDGTPRKLLDVSHISALGWKASVALPKGIAETIAWYRTNKELTSGVSPLI